MPYRCRLLRLTAKLCREHTRRMPLLLFLARAFVQTFGITQPSAAQERRAAWFIAVLMGLIVLGMVAVLVAFVSVRR